MVAMIWDALINTLSSQWKGLAAEVGSQVIYYRIILNEQPLALLD